MIFTVINIGTGYLNWLLASCSVYHRVASQGFPAHNREFSIAVNGTSGRSRDNVCPIDL